MIQGIYKFKNGRFVLSEGYGSVVETVPADAKNIDSDNDTDEVQPSLVPAKILNAYVPEGVQQNIENIKKWFNTNGIAINLDQPVEDEISDDGEQISGKIVDLSSEGISEPINVKFDYPGEDTDLKYRLIILFRICNLAFSDAHTFFKDAIEKISNFDNYKKLENDFIAELILGRLKVTENSPEENKIKNLLGSIGEEVSVLSFLIKNLKISNDLKKFTTRPVTTEQFIENFENLISSSTTASKQITEKLKETKLLRIKIKK